MSVKEIFSLRLYELRKEKGLTQEMLGKEVGAAKQTVNNWEKAANIPQLDVLCKIADFFEVSIDYLAGRTDNPKRN